MLSDHRIIVGRMASSSNAVEATASARDCQIGPHPTYAANTINASMGLRIGRIPDLSVVDRQHV